jgi:hypothetical protein
MFTLGILRASGWLEEKSGKQRRASEHINFNFYVFQEMNRKVAAEAPHRVTTVLIKFSSIAERFFLSSAFVKLFCLTFSRGVHRYADLWVDY